MEDYNDDNIIFIGRDESFLENQPMQVRIVSRDGNDFMITHDLKPDRLNVVIVDGIIKDVYYG